MTDLVLVRHGETIWHADNRYTGSTDVPLTDTGHRQATALGRWAATAPPDALWVSPLSRARDTAAAVTAATGLEPHVDERLVELDFGQGEGLTGADMLQEFPDRRRAFETDPVAHHLPGGEDPLHAVERMTACVTDITRRYPRDTVLVVGHGTVHRLLLCRLLGIPLRDYRRVWPVFRNCAITTVRWTGTGPAALIEYNCPPEEIR